MYIIFNSIDKIFGDYIYTNIYSINIYYSFL